MDMEFTPSKADPCVSMREIQKLKCYEYLATYVDDLCTPAQNPGKIIQTLKEDYKLKVEGDRSLSHNLCADYTGTRTRPYSGNQRSILTGWLIPTTPCSNRIHPKT